MRWGRAREPLPRLLHSYTCVATTVDHEPASQADLRQGRRRAWWLERELTCEVLREACPLDAWQTMSMSMWMEVVCVLRLVLGLSCVLVQCVCGGDDTALACLGLRGDVQVTTGPRLVHGLVRHPLESSRLPYYGLELTSMHGRRAAQLGSAPRALVDRWAALGCGEARARLTEASRLVDAARGDGAEGSPVEA